MPDTTPGSPTDGVAVRDGDLRRHLYDAAIALAALLVGLGLIAPDAAQLWLNLVAVAIPLAGLLLARVNAPGRHARR